MSKDKKLKQLEEFKKEGKSKSMTSNQGVPIFEDNFTLKAGDRGPSLMEDFHFQEKLRHFSRERIPERVVHARGTGAHGYFKLDKSMKKYTSADFLGEEGKETPIFIRFSTVQGSRGSAETVRDARGMAIKFYTEEGNYDIAGISFPVFFIQDAIKFPDFVHAMKPEPDKEVPQGQTAHDSFWDFISSNEESLHAVMWAMSDRGIPRSYRMMEGFGVHTFRWINDKGENFFIKYHFTPKLGIHSLAWDEAQKICGKDPDYHRKDLYTAIDKGDYPEWDVSVQILDEDDEFIFDFDILDPTKLWPEEIVPKTKIGTIVLNKNVDNFFAETEQVAFSPANLVPGITFSNDPLLQGRIFSYADAHVYRLGGPNFNNIPINMPLNFINNNQRDGFNTMDINTEKVNYSNNRRNDNNPKVNESGYKFLEDKIDGDINRGRIEKFFDFYNQPKLFFNSLSEIEQKHLIDAIKFELSKVESEDVRRRTIATFDKVEKSISKELSKYFNIEIEEIDSLSEKDNKIDTNYKYKNKKVEKTNISMMDTIKRPETFELAILVGDLDTEFTDDEKSYIQEFIDKGMYVTFIGNEVGDLEKFEGKQVKGTYHSEDSVTYDGIYIHCKEDIKDEYLPMFYNFQTDSFNHKKPIIYKEEKVIMDKFIDSEGVEKLSNKNIDVLIERRYWER